ncbi:hypothetical protein TFLX_02476 [Thermoflexales bacterium]|nr:hypothetical protein TFLX_02476 [Thermoflexales bacterium]
MPLEQLFGTELYTWVVLPLLVFGARVLDVSLGTLRIIFIARGRRRLAPLLGFFEVLIWIVVVSQVMQNLHSPLAFIAYAAGFATGNYVGMWIEDKLAIGTLIVRVIVPHEADQLLSRLSAAGYGVTSVDAHGSTGQVTLIYTVVKRKDLHAVMTIIQDTHPKAFTSVEEVRSTHEGIFPARARRFPDPLARRKG